MARASTSSDVFNAVGDGSRRAVIDALAIGEQSVGGIVAMVGLTQPQVSKHLRVLARVGIAELRIDGRRHLYSLNAGALVPMINWLSGFESLWHERFDRIDGLLTELLHERGVEGDE